MQRSACNLNRTVICMLAPIRTFSFAATLLIAMASSVAAEPAQQKKADAPRSPDPCGERISKALAEIAALPPERLKEKLEELTREIIPLCQKTQEATKEHVAYLSQYAQLLRQAEAIHEDWNICRYKTEKLGALLARLSSSTSTVRDLEIRRAEFGNFKQDANFQSNAVTAKGDAQGRTPNRCSAIHYFHRKCYVDKDGETLRGATYCIVARTNVSETGIDVCDYAPAPQVSNELQVEFRCKGRADNDIVTVPGAAKWIPIICAYPAPQPSEDDTRLTKEFFEAPPCPLKIEAPK